LPTDSFTPFDNSPSYQSPSAALIQGLGVVAEAAAAKALATAELRASTVGCTPASAGDEACFRSFVSSLGRRAMRRPLSEAEVTGFVQRFLPFAQQSNDFYVAAGLAIRTLLQTMEFVYRTEIGSPVQGQADLVALTDWELGARLSYLLWGETPDNALLGAIEQGTLSTAGGLRTEALRLLGDPRGIARVQRFHAMWLNYERLPHSAALSAAFRTETDALVRRVVFDNGAAWSQLFTSTDSYINEELAQLYSMPAPQGGGFAWTPYPDATRRGLLSQGSLLSNGAKGADTSPTRRGKFILEQLLCSPVPPPPPGIDTDEPPAAVGGTNCKTERYREHSVNPDCAGCHSIMDPVGFGLENFDLSGRFRATEDGKPECAISGQGQLPGAGAFTGPAELSQLLTTSDKLGQCLAQRLYEFAVQRPSLPGAPDAAPIQSLAAHLTSAQLSLREAMLAWLDSGAFRYRRIEPFTPEMSQ
jgi:hypothetical protein